MLPFSPFQAGFRLFDGSALNSAFQSLGNAIQPGFGQTWYVNANTGSDSQNSGLSPGAAFRTMGHAFSVVQSNDTIIFEGKIREQLSAPVGKFNVTILGGGTSPRDADAHSGLTDGGSAASWSLPTSPVASTPLLTLRQQGWQLGNFLMRADTAQVCVDLYRDGGAGDAERDASHARIIGMRFDGAGIGIRNNGGVAFVTIQGCLFRGQTTAIAHTTGAGIGTLLCWNVQGNRFDDNTNHIVAPLNQATIWGNVMGKFTTGSIDLTGGTGYNMVTQNQLGGTYTIGGGYVVAAATDDWGGNFNSGVSGGWTTADPAA